MNKKGGLMGSRTGAVILAVTAIVVAMSIGVIKIGGLRSPISSILDSPSGVIADMNQEYDQGDYEDALKHSKKFIKNYPDDQNIPEVKFKQAEIYCELGEVNPASDLTNELRNNQAYKKRIDAFVGENKFESLTDKINTGGCVVT